MIVGAHLPSMIEDTLWPCADADGSALVLTVAHIAAWLLLPSLRVGVGCRHRWRCPAVLPRLLGVGHTRWRRADGLVLPAMPYMRSSPASYSAAGVVPSPGRCPRHGYGVAIATVGAERYRAVSCGRRFGRRCGNRNLLCHGQRARASLCWSPKFIEVRPNQAVERTRRFGLSSSKRTWRRAGYLGRWPRPHAWARRTLRRTAGRDR